MFVFLDSLQQMAFASQKGSLECSPNVQMAVASEKVLWKVPPTMLFYLPVSLWGQSCVNCWHVSPSLQTTTPSCRCCWSILWVYFERNPPNWPIQNSRFKIGEVGWAAFWIPQFFFWNPRCPNGREDGRGPKPWEFPEKKPVAWSWGTGFSGWSDLGGETLQFRKATHAGNGTRADFVVRSEIGSPYGRESMGKLCFFHFYKWSYGPPTYNWFLGALWQGKLPTPQSFKGGSMSNRNAGSVPIEVTATFTSRCQCLAIFQANGRVLVKISGCIFQSQKWKLIFWHGTKHSERSTAAVSVTRNKNSMKIWSWPYAQFIAIESHLFNGEKIILLELVRPVCRVSSIHPKETPIHFSLLGADIGNLGISPPKCLTCIHEILLMVQKSCTWDVWNPVNNGMKLPTSTGEHWISEPSTVTDWIRGFSGIEKTDLGPEVSPGLCLVLAGATFWEERRCSSPMVVGPKKCQKVF